MPSISAIVVGEAILGANIFRDLFAGIRDIVGGRSAAYENALGEARETALRELEERAKARGANAVVGVDLDYEVHQQHADGVGLGDGGPAWLTDADPARRRPLTTAGGGGRAAARDLCGAGVILEYGAGGSTVLAAEIAGETVFVGGKRRGLAGQAATPGSPRTRRRPACGCTTPTSARPASGACRATTGPGARFHRYPLGVWDREDFVQPDVVLIDGRFRTGCLLAALFRRDAAGDGAVRRLCRPAGYHVVERYAEPAGITGRMARFEAGAAADPGRRTWPAS